jgi:7-cyano-7-deazaguanine synthase
LRKRSVVLVSGGLDSAVALFYAKKKGFDCHCLSFDYGQKHRRELYHARKLARMAKAKFSVVNLELPWKGSALLGGKSAIPMDRSALEIRRGNIPSTYVPARNSVFLSIAASLAETIGAGDIFIGAHFEDSSGYPDCRREFLESFERSLRFGTKRGREKGMRLHFPLLDKSKKDIIILGHSLAVPFEETWSCYKGDKLPCMRCDSCVLRAKGFAEAKMKDPLLR